MVAPIWQPGEKRRQKRWLNARAEISDGTYMNHNPARHFGQNWRTYVCADKQGFIAMIGAFSMSAAQADSSSQMWNQLMLHPVSTQSRIEAVSVAEHFGENDPRLHLALQNAAVNLSWTNNDLPLAESYFKRDIAILEKLDHNFPALASDCFELGFLYLREGRYNLAEPYLLRALAIRKVWNDLDADDPYDAEVYAALFINYDLRDESAKAAQAWTKMNEAVEVWHVDKTRALCLFKVDNCFHRVAIHAKNLSNNKKQFYLQTALHYAKASTQVLRRGANQYDYVMSIFSIGELERVLGDMPEAERMYKECLSLSEKNIDGMEYPALCTLDQLASILDHSNRWAECEVLVNDYLSKVSKTFGAQSPEYATQLDSCAQLFEHHSRTELASTTHKKAAQIRDKCKSYDSQ
jgi:tetratricopeptide (TPR) repeat protein